MPKYTLPELPYGYSSLEPYISTEIMMLHHKFLHATHVRDLNDAEEQLEKAIANNDLDKIVLLEKDIRFNGGAHINHSLFWNVLIPKGTEQPTGELAEAIRRDFGSFDKMVDQLSKASITIKGSGWGWLGYNKLQDKLEIATTQNQDSLFEIYGLYPLLGIDVWEHAYAAQYKTARDMYVHTIFKVINWIKVEEYYSNARLK